MNKWQKTIKEVANGNITAAAAATILNCSAKDIQDALDDMAIKRMAAKAPAPWFNSSMNWR